MKAQLSIIGLLIGVFIVSNIFAQKKAHNPIIYADVPDMSIIRVGDTFYMSSTTMHMSPGVPIMKSKDLVNWNLVNYCYHKLGDADELNLENGKNAYGRGSWASSIRYHKGTFYVSTFSGTAGTTYIFSTNDIENGAWEVKKFEPSYHDHTLFFDDDDKVYMIWGVGKLMLAELKEDLSGVREGTQRVLIENASRPAGENIMLHAEGSQLFKINDKYYLFNITWPRDGMRTVLIHRADKITGPYEGRLALQDRGIAQGGLVDSPEGDCYAYLFRDYGAVGRIPYLVPVTWNDGWPVLGIDGKVPEMLDLPVSRGLMTGIVASDDFRRKKGEPDLPLVWQWNHNPDNDVWKVNRRKGYLRLKTGRTDSDFLLARNTLTQRTNGPKCSGSTSINVSEMKQAVITREWKAEDEIELHLPMEVRKVKAIDEVADTRGKVALERGPLVYCVEEVDNAGIMELAVPEGTVFSSEFNPELLNGLEVVTASGAASFKAIPYYARNNRGANKMKVWLNEN